jgi:phosphocarrier protein HPr
VCTGARRRTPGSREPGSFLEIFISRSSISHLLAAEYCPEESWFTRESDMTNELVTRMVVVAHPHGLHMRPCSAIVNTVGKCQSHVEISNQRHTANARSMLDLLLLAATQGSQLLLAAEGPDADQAISAVADLLAWESASSPTSCPVERPAPNLRQYKTACLAAAGP